jgi:hypothetical protein
MKKRTRKITLSAVFTALTVLFLYLASALPTGQLAIIALSSLFGIAAVIEAGYAASIFVFAGSAVIGALILPNKPLMLLYVLFFGYYPVIKSLLEKMYSRVWEWVLKAAVFNAAVSAVWLIFRTIIFESDYQDIHTILVYVIGNIVFVLFDIGLSKLIGFYMIRISKNLGKK